MTSKYLNYLDLRGDVFDRLPRVCLTRSLIDGLPIMLKRGMFGYYPLDPDADVERFNSERGITPAQIKAMEAGSMFGWDAPAADPDHYTPDPASDIDSMQKNNNGLDS